MYFQCPKCGHNTQKDIDTRFGYRVRCLRKSCKWIKHFDSQWHEKRDFYNLETITLRKEKRIQ